MLMKTFKNLQFETIDSSEPGERATLKFENGLSISVLTGAYSYSKGLHDLYEIAMLDESGEIIYTDITNYDVVGYLSENEVTDYMNKIESADKNIKKCNLFNMKDSEILNLEKEQMQEFYESMIEEEINEYEANLQAERENIEASYKKGQRIKSKSYTLLSPELLDSSISVMYNDDNIEIISHSITSSGLTDKQFEVLADVYENKDSEDTIVIGPVMYTVTFIYKEVYDIDMG